MSEASSVVPSDEKPVSTVDTVDDLIFSEPTDTDFDEDIGEEERNYYKNKYKDLNDVKKEKLHCSACNKHLGCAARSETRMRSHPMLRTLVCHLCHSFYNSGEFEKGDDGSELYCRWCGQGGQVYCCSDCPHVFCAKCIRRNLGSSTIREIESADDWKCFRCVPKPLWDLRALCWALMRYCDLKNRLAYTAVDPVLKEKYQQACAIDDSSCCKDKRKKSIVTSSRRKEPEEVPTKPEVIAKIPPTIQVKKFASINANESLNEDTKKAQKRPGSPIKLKQNMLKRPLQINQYVGPQPPPLKKIKITQPVLVPNPVKINEKQFVNIRPKLNISLGAKKQMPFNGYRGCIPNDNINLSLESLTQGLDMTSMAAIASSSIQNTNNSGDNVVCTPDLLLEPLCEVSEDNNDDDVQCMTPGPIVAPKLNCPPPPPPLVPRPPNSLPDISPENIIQMTENDVTINAATGGLKFRIDPQTLSCKKMYRLPDGRIFAINPNPNMPGGYSATIVAITESNAPKSHQKSSSPAPTPPRQRNARTPRQSKTNNPQLNQSKAKVPKVTDITKTRDCDLDTPVEWYRYNLIDGIDALQYSLLRLQKLKREATTQFLRTRTVDEMKNLHSTLERILNNSSSRFKEIRETLNKGLRSYLLKKGGHMLSDDDDENDDDVEILPNAEDNDDPIFIDENSVDSNKMETSNTIQNDIDLLCNERDVIDKANQDKTSETSNNIHGENNVTISSTVDDAHGTVQLDSSNEIDNDDKLNESSVCETTNIETENSSESDVTKENDTLNLSEIPQEQKIEEHETAKATENDIEGHLQEDNITSENDSNKDDSKTNTCPVENGNENDTINNGTDDQENNDMNVQENNYTNDQGAKENKSEGVLEDNDKDSEIAACENKNNGDQMEINTSTKTIENKNETERNEKEKDNDCSEIETQLDEKREDSVNCNAQSSPSKIDDKEMTEEMIENLLGGEEPEPEESEVVDSESVLD